MLKTDRDSGISMSVPSSPSKELYPPTQGRPLEREALQSRAIYTEEEFDMDCPRGRASLASK